MTDKELSGRNRLKEAMKLSDQTYLDKYPPIENEVKYSEKYLKYIDRLTKQTKSPFYKYFNTIGKRVAGIAAAMLIAFSCSMTVKAIREPVVEFLANIYEKFVEIFFGEDDIEQAPSAIQEVYTLDLELDEFRIDTCVIKSLNTEFVWINDEGEEILFNQMLLSNRGTLDYDNSNYMVQNVLGKKIVKIEKLNQKIFYWNSDDYAFALTVPCDFSDDLCIDLIESMVLYE